MNRSSVEHLVQNLVCGRSYNETKCKILRTYNNIFNLVKIEAIFIHLNESYVSKKNLIIHYPCLVNK